MENPIKMDDLGVPLFLETPICYKISPFNPATGSSSNEFCCWAIDTCRCDSLLLKMRKASATCIAFPKLNQVPWFLKWSLHQNSFLCHSAIPLHSKIISTCNPLPPWHVLSLTKTITTLHPSTLPPAFVPQIFWLVFWLVFKKKNVENVGFPHDGKCNSNESFRFVEVRIVVLKSSNVTCRNFPVRNLQHRNPGGWKLKRFFLEYEMTCWRILLILRCGSIIGDL